MLRSEFAIRRSVSRLCLLVLLLLLGTRARATIYYVSPTGNDANSGTSWATAKATVNAANSLTIANDQIWVAAGKYTLTATINLNNGVELYGGFNGTETLLSQRNYIQNVTILDGNKKILNTVVTPVQADVRTRVDGFTFQNGYGTDFVAQGDVTLANNTFNEPGNSNVAQCIALGLSGGRSVFVLNNQINGGNFGWNNFGGSRVGLIASDDGTCTVTINGNTFRNCVEGGIFVTMHSAVVSGNTVLNCGGAGINVETNTAVINGNTVTACGNGFLVGSTGQGPPTLYLTFTQNSAQDNALQGMYVVVSAGAPVGIVSDNVSISNEGTGLVCGGPLVIKDNLMANNGTPGAGGGLFLFGSNGGWTVANNTIVDNVAGGPTDGGGIYITNMSNSYTYNIANNVVAFNSSGIDTDGSTTSTLTLTTNDVYGSDNKNNNYDGLPPGATDISLDPMFVDHMDLNYHLTSASPCIDAGTDSFVAPGDTDLDGNPRIYGAHVDIGCYEWTPSAYPDLASFAISPTTLCSGQSTTGLITLSSAALPAGAVVQLTSTSLGVLTVPASVTVTGGSNAALFTVTANAVIAPQTTVVSATYRGITQSVTVTVNPLIGSITLAPPVVIGGASVTGTIALNCPAPAAFTINLQSNSASVTVPASVSVAIGATSATFTATTTSVSAVQSVILTATGGAQTLTATLIVDPSAVAFKSLGIAPSTVTGGLSSAGVVTLTAVAPAGGVEIPITSSKPAAASPPITVTVPAGKRSAAFVIPTSVVSASTAVTLTATLGMVTKTVKLTVLPATIASLTLLPSTVEGGTENSIGIVTLAAAATSPVVVTLSGGAVATPDVISIIIPTGAIQGTFNISTITVTAPTTATIQASVYGATKKAILTMIP